MISDADFLLGPPVEDGTDTYVLCEINCSCVTPFPPEAPDHIALRQMSLLLRAGTEMTDRRSEPSSRHLMATERQRRSCDPSLRGVCEDGEHPARRLMTSDSHIFETNGLARGGESFGLGIRPSMGRVA